MPEAEWAALAVAVGGGVQRGDPARTGPAAVVRCTSVADIVAALGFARRTRLALGGDGGIALDLTKLRGVGIEGVTAVVGAGTSVGEVNQALTTHLFALPVGDDPATGIVELTLAGGIGPLGRRFGLTCDRVTEAEVVLADGAVVICDAEREPDLFWALRGAGTAMPGIVTRLRFAIVRQQPPLVRFGYPPGSAADVVAAWQELDPPDEVTVGLRLGAQPVVEVHGAPSIDLGVETVAVGDDRCHGSFAGGWFFDHPLSMATIDSLVADHGGSWQFVPLGGAYNRVPPDATAFVHRTDRFLLVATADDHDWVRRAAELVRGESTGRAYQLYPGAGEAAYHGANRDRLDRVRRHYDPDGLISPRRRGTAG